MEPLESRGTPSGSATDNRGRGYNPRLMPSIWYTPKVPSCQSHIYIVLKANQAWGLNAKFTE